MGEYTVELVLCSISNLIPSHGVWVGGLRICVHARETEESPWSECGGLTLTN